MTDRQAGVCAICLAASAEHVDHDHTTGHVRGVLCFNCNVAIGQFKDDPWVLQRAIEYLRGTLIGPRRAAPGLVAIAEVCAGAAASDADPQMSDRIAT
jgi:Recombination endonuclease VII